MASPGPVDTRTTLARGSPWSPPGIGPPSQDAPSPLASWATATHAIAVLRGTSARPLFVTAAGMPRAEAAELVRHMAGRFRVPDVLRRADQLARTTQPADTQASHHPS